jgi:pimeloyl-[acyl-carrier protein] methyl ester esterase
MTIRVDVRGRGPDLVLLHGWGLNGAAWGPWLDGLAGIARLHVIDLPGHGSSPWPRGIATLEALSAHVAGVVPARALLCGWSLGGLVALEIARQQVRNLAGLVLIATTPRFVAAPDWPCAMAEALLRDFGERLRSDYARTVRDFLALQALGDERQRETLRTLRDAVASRPAPDPGGLAHGIEILLGADLRAASAAIATPALVIAGERDRLTPPAAARALAASLRSASFCLIPRAAHAPFLPHAAEVLAVVEQFVVGLSVAARSALPAPEVRA